MLQHFKEDIVLLPLQTCKKVSKDKSDFLRQIYSKSACMAHLEFEVLQNLPEQERITTLGSI